MSRTKILLVLSAATVVSVAHAQPYQRVEVVRPLPGWQCMALASAYEKQGIYAPPAPVYASPQPDSAQIGTGAGVIIVPSDIKPTNGRIEIIRPNGQKAWIDINQLAPWHSLSDPHAVCQPGLLSNGRYGFKTTG